MPNLRKTFIIALTTALACLVWFEIFELIHIVISNESYIHIVMAIHLRLAIPILLLGYSAGLLAVGCAGLMWMRKREKS